jgi:hypothetical protein
MSTVRGSAHYAGLLPVEPPDEPPPVRPTTLENDRPPNGQPSLRKRASRALSRFLIAFCVGVAATLAWQSYGDTARQIIANSYPQLRWFAPRAEQVAQKAPETIALVAPAFDQQQFSAMSLNIDAVRQSVDRIAAGQEQIARSIDQIAAGQGQMTRGTDQTATSIAEAPSAKASGITVESRADEASLQPTARLDMKLTEARPPQTLSERGKQLSAASGPDASCFPSASAVLENHRGASWTMKAPGHEGTLCWYAAARPRASDPRISDHQREMMPREKGTVGTTENGLSAAPAPHTRAPE